MKLLMLKGLQASGKSTYAKNLVNDGNGNWKRVNKDDLRLLLDNGKWSRDREKTILQIQKQVIKGLLQEGFNVVIDDTNFAPKHEESYRQIAKEYNAEFETMFFDVPLHECIRRDAQRPNPVGEKVIYDTYRRYLQPEPCWKQNKDKPIAYCFDIDGTIALMGDRNPFDASTCENDELNLPVTKILQKMSDSATIILCSGREEKYREQTLRWLVANNLPFDQLYMRKTGDSRKDSIIKKEIYQQEILPNYRIMAVFDDRLQVVQMLRDELGLIVFSVDWGYF